MVNNTLTDWQTATDLLLDDVLHAAAQVDCHGDGYSRRGYVRAVFAAIEGSTYGMKRVVLEVWKHRQLKLDADDLERLTETKFDQQGKSKKRFLPFGDSIKFAFGAFAKVHGFAPAVDYNVKGWTSLISAAEVRHRLMHPKSSSDLAVSDGDLDMIRDACDWYFMNRNQLVASATIALKRDGLKSSS